MFKVYLVACLLFANLSAFAADSTSSVEGRVLDGQGRPMSGVTVVAVQTERIKGYDELRVDTNADGTFRVTGLYPKSPYILGLGHEDQQDKNAEWVYVPKPQPYFTAAPAGETRALGDITARFMSFSNGLVTDTHTGLQWRVGPAQKTTLDQAKDWIASLPADGGPAWQLPTPDQVGTLLYLKDNQRLICEELGDLNGVWSFLTTKNSVTTRASRTHEGAAWMTFMDSRGSRAIAVRNAPAASMASATVPEGQEPIMPSGSDSANTAADRRALIQNELRMTTTPNDFWYDTGDAVVLVMPKQSSGTLTRDQQIQALRDALTEADGR
ncbi:MAG: carboxypeptidase regulatory-like domain-containing protein [Candidatus Hydrogenedentes bacterium]|nr:carboxypeptidase regulatory-like domain-containing protein [Candidatus Hydrogenedentota bacterium]